MNPDRDIASAKGKRRLQPSAAIKVIEQIPVALEPAERERLRRLAHALRASEPALDATAFFGAQVSSGLGPGLTVVIEDHSAISLFEEAGDIAYAYRSLLLGGPDDIVLIGVPRNPAFEAYCSQTLGLGPVEVLGPRLGTVGKSLTQRALNDPILIDELARRARRHGGLNLLPYMGIGGVWTLAARLAAASGMPVRVAAPPPRLTRRVNDKSWFAACVEAALGAPARPPSVAVHSFAGLVAQLAAFARSHPGVAIKLPDSASSAGNLILDPHRLRARSLKRLRDWIAGVLRDLGWRGGFPLLVTAWEGPILASPSAQLWIPDPRDGPPLVEGIFDQTVLGERAVFSGAAPSALPTDLQYRIAAQAARLGSLFQELGYFGRCSFDSIVLGTAGTPGAVHWVECNGRWGGVSIPLTVANRLTGDWTRSPPVIVERVGLQGRPRSLGDILAALDDLLYRPDGAAQGLVLLAPGRLEAGSGFEAMLLAESAAAGRAQAGALAARILSAMGAVPETLLGR